MPHKQAELIASVAGSWIIAVVTAMLFFMLCRVWLRLSRAYRHKSIFAAALLHSPGYALRRRLRARGEELRVILATLLLLPLFFGAVLLAWPGELQANPGEMRWLVMIVVATAIIGYLLHTLGRLLIGQSRTRYALSADIAVSHSLERVMKQDFSVFHDVRCGDVVTNKVVVGSKGVFALNLFIYPKRRRETRLGLSARYDGHCVTFPDGSTFELTRQTSERAQGVARYLSLQLGKPVPVCPVLVLPGWDLECEVQPRFPVVNERNIDMITEWIRPEAHLLNEEEAALHKHLCGTCRDRRYKAA